MIEILKGGAYLLDGQTIVPEEETAKIKERLNAEHQNPQTAKKGTMAYKVLESHNQSGNMEKLQIKFDALTSHDITYVGIVQTARASGMTEFPLPYILTNCHNSLSAVGGTINEDDHVFGLSAAKKYGGIYVPAHMAVIHQYMREMFAGGGKMILGSDSHTRYGALGTMAIGEGGPELVKQLLGRTYDINMPEVFAVKLVGKPRPGVGPMDVALALVGATFKEGIVTNKVLEFVGDGVKNLSTEYRIGIDVMTTETTCLTSIWETDTSTKDYLTQHGRAADYKELKPDSVAYYDGALILDLSKVPSMVAMPFHPSNIYSINELNANLPDIMNEIENTAKFQLGNPTAHLGLKEKVKNGGLMVDQAIIVGCSGGTYENISDAADILEGSFVGTGGLGLSVYPSSQPINMAITKAGIAARLMGSGAIVRSAFCGPCFGAGEVPANGALSLRHATRNFPNRDGSKPGENQATSVALADARSIAATVRNGGKLTAATEFEVKYNAPAYYFDKSLYENRNYNGYGHPQPETELVFGPNITSWPEMQPLADSLFLKFASVISDPVTTTDELIPSGETSSYRSNPLRLAEYALSRKDPEYVGRAKAVHQLEKDRLNDICPLENEEFNNVVSIANQLLDSPLTKGSFGIGSAVYAVRPGDGSAREQAASSQKVLGTLANVAKGYATKRYRSNLINWGMLPFIYDGEDIPFEVDDYLFVPNIRKAVENKTDDIKAFIIKDGKAQEITLHLGELTDAERQIILDGCLINYYKNE